jgi:hypothetical protein
VARDHEAPGVMVATGYVRADPRRTRGTYLTRDGGASWQRIWGNQSYPLLRDLGSLIVLLDDRGHSQLPTMV